MVYYVKGFDSFPLKLSIASSNHPEIGVKATPKAAIADTIKYCRHTLSSWRGDKSVHGKNVSKKMRAALSQLKKLSLKYP